MKKIRRYGCAVVAAIMALTMTACEEEGVQSNQTPQDGAATTAATTTPPATRTNSPTPTRR